jgi:hypothetical protein
MLQEQHRLALGSAMRRSASAGVQRRTDYAPG